MWALPPLKYLSPPHQFLDLTGQLVDKTDSDTSPDLWNLNLLEKGLETFTFEPAPLLTLKMTRQLPSS